MSSRFIRPRTRDQHAGFRRARRALFTAALTAAVGVAIATPAAALPTPQQKCQSNKNKAAGKYSACRQNAEAKLATSGDTSKYTTAIGKCTDKLTKAWTKAEADAAAHAATCLDGTATEPTFQLAMDAHSTNIAAALAGGYLDFCGDGAIDPGEQCDQNNLAGESCVSLGYSFGPLHCGAGCVFDTSDCWSPPRWSDNGDGTVTDHELGLMWEKKEDLDGAPVTCTNALVCPNPHDADNLYTWTNPNVPTSLPTGSVFTVLLTQLNGGAGFAGYTDWRLPTLAELQSLVDYADATAPMTPSAFDSACAAGCTIATCSCTNPTDHWTDTSLASTPSDAYILHLGDGGLTRDTKDTDYAARAVRTIP